MRTLICLALVSRAGSDTPSCSGSASGCASNPKRRTWSEDFLVVPTHPLCQKQGRDFQGEQVLEAVQSLPWTNVYQGFRPRALFPGGPVFPESTPEDRVADAKPEVTLVFDSTLSGGGRRTVLGANVECPHCGQSGIPNLVPAVLPPRLLKGRSYLEVAGLDGPRCFWAEENGATDIVCTDYHGWGGVEDANTHGFSWRKAANMSRAEVRQSQRGYGTLHLDFFKLTKCLTNSKVQALRLNIYDLSADLMEHATGRRSFDVVYAGGLIYHLKHPVLGFEALADVTSGVLIFETEVLKPPTGVDERWHRHGIGALKHPPGVRDSSLSNQGYRDEPSEEAALCRWFREGELLGDPTNFWSCTAEATASMLRAAGFPFVHLLGLELFPGLRASPWRDRRVFAAAKTRQGDLRIVHSYPEPGALLRL